jgi:predicted nucleotidyltransferase component of viral defense system
MQNSRAAVQDPKEITKLKDAIRAMHGCESLHVESVAVKEVFEGQTAWETKVEVFDLVGHRQAKRAYAWSYRDANQNKTFAVLEIPPVDSPESAVKVAIASKARSN